MIRKKQKKIARSFKLAMKRENKKKKIKSGREKNV
jgi:hypothetical protein